MAKNYNKNKKLSVKKTNQRLDNENRILNLTMRMGETVAGLPTKFTMADSAPPTKSDISAFESEIKGAEDTGDYEVIQPNDVEAMDAPTSNFKRPRALSIGYERGSRTVTVVFRDNTWWEYRDVSEDLWNGLKNSDSTGKYLRSSGLDIWHDMGPAEVKSMQRSYRVQLNHQASISARIQKVKGFMDTLSKEME